MRFDLSHNHTAHWSAESSSKGSPGIAIMPCSCKDLQSTLEEDAQVGSPHWTNRDSLMQNYANNGTQHFPYDDVGMLAPVCAQ